MLFRLRWDHPRLRGNYGLLSLLTSIAGGSPPLTRELHISRLGEVIKLGITPAYAGTTVPNPIFLGSRQDHPRLRGNYSCFFIYVLADSGSYPLTRELLHKFYK